MRLIDADKLKTTKGMFIYQTEDADVIATEAYRWELIEREAPTVKAIPIEWLRQWFAENRFKFYDDNDNIYLVCDIEEMLLDWEKEKC